MDYGVDSKRGADKQARIDPGTPAPAPAEAVWRKAPLKVYLRYVALGPSAKNSVSNSAGGADNIPRLFACSPGPFGEIARA